MKKTLLAFVFVLGLAVAHASPKSQSKGAVLTANALPFTLSFQEQTFATPPPGVHSYSAALVAPNRLLILGGRQTPSGLHQFASNNNNFPNPNNQMLVIDPTQGLIGQFNVTNLSWSQASLLQASNQASYYDATSGYLYVLGGYGPTTADGNLNNYGTFPTILRMPAAQVVDAILNNSTPQTQAAAIAPLIQVCTDSRLQVTGAGLFELNGTFFLVFGQTATGMYEAFGGNFSQTYTCDVAFFQPNPSNFSAPLLNYGISNVSNDYHRRDGSVVASRDPSSGAEILTAFGGVFPPGIIGCYTRPVFITAGQTLTESKTQLKFGAYECPVIGAYSQANKTVYHTFFGGIGHYFFSQTASQQSAYNTVTQQGRNDGMPFIGDISTFVRNSKGVTQEWIASSPISALGFPPPSGQAFPSNLRGAGAEFIPNPAAGAVIGPDGVIQLDQLPSGQNVLIGYIYGGIEAQNPLPLVPNQGSQACSAFYAVYISNTPASAYSSKYAIQAKGTVTTPQQKAATSSGGHK